MILRTPRSTRTLHTLSLHDALPILVGGHAVALDAEEVVRPAGRVAHEQLEAGVGRLEHVALGLEALQVLGEGARGARSEEHTSELQSLMRISYAVLCLKQKKYHDFYHVGR